MKFTLTIECDNAAFDDGNAPDEVARILRDAAKRVVAQGRPLRGETKLRDVNGNTVGEFEFDF